MATTSIDSTSQEKPIGFLTTQPGEKGFRVVGVCCASKREHSAPIYPVNLRPYRQTCIECGADLLGNAKAPIGELFDGR
jgi:hypothetical protein